jgi:hypothetical protein
MSIPTDSLISAAERRAKMKAEADERARERKEAEQRRLEREKEETARTHEENVQLIEKQAALVEGDETREHLLQRLREMRADVPQPPKTMPLTERMRKQTEEEQEMGRKTAERNRAEFEAARELRLKAEREDAARQGTMAPVHHPNPTMNEKFPVNKGTLK